MFISTVFSLAGSLPGTLTTEFSRVLKMLSHGTFTHGSSGGVCVRLTLSAVCLTSARLTPFPIIVTLLFLTFALLRSFLFGRRLPI